MTVAMDAMAVAIHIKYLVGQNEQLTFYLHAALEILSALMQCVLICGL